MTEESSYISGTDSHPPGLPCKSCTEGNTPLTPTYITADDSTTCACTGRLYEEDICYALGALNIIIYAVYTVLPKGMTVCKCSLRV